MNKRHYESRTTDWMIALEIITASTFQRSRKWCWSFIHCNVKQTPIIFALSHCLMSQSQIPTRTLLRPKDGHKAKKREKSSNNPNTYTTKRVFHCAVHNRPEPPKKKMRSIQQSHAGIIVDAVALLTINDVLEDVWLLFQWRRAGRYFGVWATTVRPTLYQHNFSTSEQKVTWRACSTITLTLGQVPCECLSSPYHVAVDPWSLSASMMGRRLIT